MNKKVQFGIQILFLGIFGFLVFRGMIQLWMGVFIIGVLLSPLFGRLYCGYACPINTAMKPISFLKRRWKIPTLRTPGFLSHPSARWVSFTLFIAAFAFTLATGNPLPILPALFLLGVFVALVFDEAVFHRHICPYGTILSVSSRPSKRTVEIDEDECIGCGKCERVCPTLAVHHENRRYWIEAKECLTCMECVRHCPVDAIDYAKRSAQ